MMILYNILYRFIFVLKRLQREAKRPKWKRFIQKTYQRCYGLFSLFLNKKMIPYFEKHPAKNGLNRKKRKQRYTVSLTSFPARIEYVWIAVETLLRQKFKPDNVVLYLADSQFPDRALPDSLRRLEARGLTVRFCDDLRSHKKYFYAFRDYADDAVILADDDLFFPTDMLKKLVSLHERYPQDIIASNVQIIGPTIRSLPSEWPYPATYRKYIHSEEAQTFTGAGSLFPPHWYDDDLFDKEAIRSMAFTCDDLWLKAYSLKKGVPTTRISPFRPFPVSVDIPNDEPLFAVNRPGGGNQNDICWAKLCQHFGLEEKSDHVI